MARRRSIVWKMAPTVWVLLMVISAVAYAAISFSAKTGKAEVRSKALGATIDVTMAVPADGNCTAATYTTGDLVTDLFSISNAQPGQTLPPTTVCLRNVGARTASGSIGTSDQQSIDESCTGDEGQLDPSCGTGAGELMAQLRLVARTCDTNAQLNNFDRPDQMQAVSVSVAPGATACVRFDGSWPAQSWQNETASQTDLAAWRYQAFLSAV